MDAKDVVVKLGLKPLFSDHLMVGFVGPEELKADDVEQLHYQVTNDILKLIPRIKAQRVPVCGVLNFDGNCVTSVARTPLATNAIPVMYLTTVSPDLANNKSIWYADDWKKTFLQSCSIVLNYGNKDLEDYYQQHSSDYEGLEFIERPLREHGVIEQDLQHESDPYGKFWTDVHNHLRIQRMAYHGIRINQVIDLRPPKWG